MGAQYLLLADVPVPGLAYRDVSIDKKQRALGHATSRLLGMRIARSPMRRREIGRLGDAGLVESLTARLRERGPLSTVAAPQLADLLRQGALAEVDKGEALIREGEPADGEVYVLVEGALVVQSKGQYIARLDQPGDVVGEVAVLLSSKRTADVLAESAVRAVAIPSNVLLQPEFADVASSIRAALLRDDWVQY